ncbi:MAG: tRNA lysidine(34) synthetase TilS [Burkholderiales bacterium]|nr:tRNA lysidine(34) synthetase TilS [Burkholderiales bacterium]
MSSIERALLSLPQPETPRSLLVAFSGGLDSVVLLDALHRLREKMPHITALLAAHVHHGLSANADDWLAFCERFCAARAIPLTARRLTLSQKSQASLEETARHARHAALRDMAAEASADTIVLAHHQDDQAETLLLQLLRGAGPQGLAAMAAYHPSPPTPQGERGAETNPRPSSTDTPFEKGAALWRPLLDVPRAVLLAYARTHELEWIEDESNAETGFKRNFLRHRILPVLEEGFPAYRKTLSRAATLQAETVVTLAEVYRETDETKARFPLDLSWLKTLSEAFARHVLRTAFRHAGLRAPTFARLSDMLRQLQHARPDARIELRHGGQCLGIHRGRIMLYTPVAPYRVSWHGEDSVTLPHGVLRLTPGKENDSLRDALNQGKDILIASRQHERETLKPAANRPRRLLCDWLREAGVPHWARDTWPRIYCDGEIVFVPGVGNEAWLSFLCHEELYLMAIQNTIKNDHWISA